MAAESLYDKLGFSESLGECEDSKVVHLTSTTEDVVVDPAQVFEAARKSLNFLAGLCMPMVFKYLYPSVFLSVWDWLCQYVDKTRAFPQLALGLPRGFGKTTLIKIFVLYSILFTNKRFILIISNTASLAENILSDIADMLDEPNIKAIFGDWRMGMEMDRQELKKFGFRGRNIILAGLGVGGSLRGLNLKNERPDVMIFEDIQSREEAESQKVSSDMETWMYGTAMKAKSPHGCMFLFIANMYPTKWSILKKLKSNPTWIKFIAGGILADGTSLWEELQPLEQLLQEFQNDLIAGHPEIFYSEVLNDETASVNSRIDISKLPRYPFADDDIHTGNFIMIDPATDKQKADEVSIGYSEIHNTRPCLIEIQEGRFSPGKTIEIALEMALRRRCYLIVVEGNAYQYSLLYWFQFICAQRQIEGINCVDIYSGVSSKISRILNMFKGLESGEIFYHPSISAPVNLQLTQFNALRRDNTDGLLDLLTYGPKIVEQYAEYLNSHSILEAQEWRAMKVVEFNSSF